MGGQEEQCLGGTQPGGQGLHPEPRQKGEGLGRADNVWRNSTAGSLHRRRRDPGPTRKCKQLLNISIRELVSLQTTNGWGSPGRKYIEYLTMNLSQVRDIGQSQLLEPKWLSVGYSDEL